MTPAGSMAYPAAAPHAIDRPDDCRHGAATGTRAWIGRCKLDRLCGDRGPRVLARSASEQLGGRGALAYSEGDDQGRQKPFGLNLGSTWRGVNLNVHEIRRVLIAASEMQQDSARR